MAYQDAGLTSFPDYLLNEYASLSNQSYPFDRYEFDHERADMAALIDPSNMSTRSASSRYRAGIYVPENYVLPLGDNRDNSSDGRYFGPVKEETINGRVIARFWPLNRIGNLMDK